MRACVRACVRVCVRERERERREGGREGDLLVGDAGVQGRCEVLVKVDRRPLRRPLRRVVPPPVRPQHCGQGRAVGRGLGLLMQQLSESAGKGGAVIPDRDTLAVNLKKLV